MHLGGTNNGTASVSKTGFTAFALMRTSKVTLGTGRVGAGLNVRSTTGNIGLAFGPSHGGASLRGPFDSITFVTGSAGSKSFICMAEGTSGRCLRISATCAGGGDSGFLTFGCGGALDGSLTSRNGFLFACFPSRSSLMVRIGRTAHLDTSIGS